MVAYTPPDSIDGGHLQEEGGVGRAEPPSSVTGSSGPAWLSDGGGKGKGMEGMKGNVRNHR